MKDFELFANKIKDNYDKQREININFINRNCKAIRDDFEKLIKKLVKKPILLDYSIIIHLVSILKSII